MCQRIDTEFILASLLHYQDTVTFGEVKAYVDRVYSHFKNRSLFLDVSSNSIYGAIQGSAGTFSLKGEYAISKAENSGNYFQKSFILTHLGRSLDTSLKKGLFDLVKK